MEGQYTRPLQHNQQHGTNHTPPHPNSRCWRARAHLPEEFSRGYVRVPASNSRDHLIPVSRTDSHSLASGYQAAVSKCFVIKAFAYRMANVFVLARTCRTCRLIRLHVILRPRIPRAWQCGAAASRTYLSKHLRTYIYTVLFNTP